MYLEQGSTPFLSGSSAYTSADSMENRPEDSQDLMGLNSETMTAQRESAQRESVSASWLLTFHDVAKEKRYSRYHDRITSPRVGLVLAFVGFVFACIGIVNERSDLAMYEPFHAIAYFVMSTLSILTCMGIFWTMGG